MNILIVDDDEGDRRLLRRAIKQSGLEAECTETVTIEDALQACAGQTFDCAIVDYRIPGMDGLAGISALKEGCPHMGIIMATGQGDEMVAADAMKRGASDYIPKALITAASLNRTVTNAIEKEALRKKVGQQHAELTTFARTLVHDLKSPLGTMRGFAQIIQRDLKKGDLEDASEYCDLIVQGANRMGALIDALYQYAAAGKPFEFKPLAMDRVIEDTLNNLETLMKDRGATVAASALPAVNGHGPLLAQLLQNLIANGIKYSRVAPQIQIAASLRSSNDWVFSVKDNGIGIDPRFFDEIFEPFKRLHGNGGEFEGSGLGLATCKKIVEVHGGEIWCESQEGEGTTFFFTLPKAREMSAGQAS